MNTQNPFSENPYQAPSYSVEDEFQNVPTRDWSLGWILFSFEGRIPRRVFWGASIGTTLVFYALVFAISLAAASFSEPGVEYMAESTNPVEALLVITMLILYIPMLWISFAIQAKRWHDIGKSGWWILVSFIPLIGPIWAFIANGCLRGEYGPNEYGADQT